MSNTILLKRSGTPASVPAAANLSLGEVSLNYADGILYFKNSSNVVTVLANANTVAGTQLVNGTSNVVVASNANVTVGSAGTANVLTISSTGTVVSGTESVTGNITGGNILTVGQVSATGNVSGNFFVGNGAFLTGLSAGSSNGISNGATNISIPVASGNIAMSVAGQANTVVINLGSFTMYGTFATPKTLNANVIVAPSVNALLFGPVSLGTAYSITVPDSSTLYIGGPFA
jgi:hypothetical protein